MGNYLVVVCKIIVPNKIIVGKIKLVNVKAQIPEQRRRAGYLAAYGQFRILADNGNVQQDFSEDFGRLFVAVTKFFHRVSAVAGMGIGVQCFVPHYLGEAFVEDLSGISVVSDNGTHRRAYTEGCYEQFIFHGASLRFP